MVFAAMLGNVRRIGPVPRRFPAYSRALGSLETVKKTRRKAGFRVNTSAAVALDTTFALAAVETILNGVCSDTSQALALNIRQLSVPLEALISVPVDVRVRSGEARNEWRLRIRAVSKPHLYPRFAGVLTLIPAADQGCQLQLSGEYAPPLGAIGRVIDATVLRGAAQSSLERFVREIAYRIAALARWASAP